MFSIFKNKKNETAKYNELLIAISKLLPENFGFIYREINEGIVSSYKNLQTPFVNYNKIVQDVTVLNNFENKLARYFAIKGIAVFDNISQKNVEVRIYCAFGIILGFSTPEVKNIDPDLSLIDVSKYRIEYFENDADKLKKIISPDAFRLLNEDDIYEVEIGDISYFHLKDIQNGDGDFIGVNQQGETLIFTHDPFEIKPSETPLRELLSKN